MRYLALATDYDGTIAQRGIVDAATIDALRRLRASGRKLILVTGRHLNILDNLPDPTIFDRLVLENGALLYDPAARTERVLGSPPSEEFLDALRRRGVALLGVGRAIIATERQHATVIEETLRELGLDWRLIFNKDDLMILPPGIDKASGLRAVLDDLGIAPENVVGVGDAENDEALLLSCGIGVAVANANPALKQQADWVTASERGAGVAELIDRLIADDLNGVTPHPRQVCPF